MSNRIYVYIITDDKYKDSVYQLKKIFKKCNYHISYINKDKHIYNYKHKCERINRTRNEYNQELNNKYNTKANKKINYFFKSLTTSYNHDPDSYTLIIKDSSIYNLDDKYMLKTIIDDSININNWDISYLCRWMDNKSKQEYITNIDHIEVYNIFSPNGIQSLLISPQGRNRILGIKPLHNSREYFDSVDLNDSLRHTIEKSDLKAIGYSKNIFIYNPLNLDMTKNKHKFIMYHNPNTHKEETMHISTYLLSIATATLFILLFDIIKRNN